MNLYITVGYSADGKAKVVGGPELSYEEHKKLLRSMDGKGFERAELWSRSSGKTKQRRLRAKLEKKAKTKSDKDENNEENNNEK